jgi:hypothetical protein
MAAPFVYFEGTWSLPYTHTVLVKRVGNVTVEGLPDATLVGSLTNFRTDDSYYACLNGESVGVWTAPQEFPGDLVVHNGDQGPQCTYGTWLFPETYTGLWYGKLQQLRQVKNVSVEDLPDATLLPEQLQDFQTNVPYYACLDGKALNAWNAPGEFPGDPVVHNGDQGPQCTYITLRFVQ